MDRFAAMQAFVKVVETGSFSEAGRQMRLGQPALSKTVAGLEQRLGSRLLLRSSKGLTPTEAGQNFYEHAVRALASAEEAELAARGAGAGLTGRLRVSGAITFFRITIVPALGAFLARHPALDVELVLDDRNIDLLEEGIDVALRMGTLADSSLLARRIGRSRRVITASAAYLSRMGEPRHPSELTRHDVVLYMGGGGENWTFRKAEETATVTVKSRLRSTAAEAVRAAVIGGFGLTLASEWMFLPELRDGQLCEVLTDWSLPPADLWAIYPTGRQATAKARAFVAFVEEVMARDSVTVVPRT